jgi:hypothetical protein
VPLQYLHTKWIFAYSVCERCVHIVTLHKGHLHRTSQNAHVRGRHGVKWTANVAFTNTAQICPIRHLVITNCFSPTAANNAWKVWPNNFFCFLFLLSN